jgi:hypothetical protein
VRLHNENQEEFNAELQLDEETLLAACVSPGFKSLGELEELQWEAKKQARDKAQAKLSQDLGLAFGTILSVLTNHFAQTKH